MPPRGLPRDERYTWTDYRSWPDDERWEIIDGIAYNMAAAPSTRHQIVSGNFFSQLEHQLSGKRYTPFIAPADVRLPETDVVQPDILVVCDPSKITPSHIEGAPDLVVEVLSPSTSAKDLREKKRLYQRVGVAEYLVVDPLEMYVQRFLLSAEGRYGEPEIFSAQETLELATLEGIAIALWEVFDVAPPEAPASAPPQ